jgi:hypothetical protein
MIVDWRSRKMRVVQAGAQNDDRKIIMVRESTCQGKGRVVAMAKNHSRKVQDKRFALAFVGNAAAGVA